MAKPISEQLLAAWEASDLTLEQLLSGIVAIDKELSCDIGSLSRKLHGKQILTTREAETIAQVLKTSIAWSPKRKTVGA